MKKLMMVIASVCMVANSSFAQGTVNFKTIGTKNPVLYSTDNVNFAPLPTTGAVGGFGTVSYEVYTAPDGTPLTGSFGPNFTSAWTGTPVSSVTYSAPGVISGMTLTLPAASGAPGQNVEMEIVAYLGSLSTPAMYGYTGMSTIYSETGAYTYNGQNYSTGVLGWSQPTGNPNTPPDILPATLIAGSAGFGSLVLAPVPEPGTFALGGLAAGALLLFGRRK